MPNIHHALLIGASAEAVYWAITRQEGLSKWWTPEVEATAEVNSIARFYFGPEHLNEMRIAELKPCTGVKWECIGANT